MGNVNRSDRAMSARRLRVSVRKNPRPLPPRRALRLARRPIDCSRTTAERFRLARAVAEARVALAEAVFATAEAAARASSVAEALASLSQEHRGPVAVASPTTLAADAVLSPREREVLALVAAGQTNKDIAAALFVSPNTVKTNVASLLTKLHANTRAQLATIAAQRGLA
jgi:DNA-binding NarL/FixJ family response regulator